MISGLINLPDILVFSRKYIFIPLFWGNLGISSETLRDSILKNMSYNIIW